jgi:beta-glucosidase
MKKRLSLTVCLILAFSSAVCASCKKGGSFRAEVLESVSDSAAAYVADNPRFARESASEGMVLLKNDNGALPLKPGARVAALGGALIGYYAGGGGSGYVTPPYTVTPLAGLRNAEGAGVVTLNREILNAVESGSAMTESAIAAAGNSDTALYFIGRQAGEGNDLAPSPGGYYLSATELTELRWLSKHFDKLVVVLNVGNAIDTSWLYDADISADGLLVM